MWAARWERRYAMSLFLMDIVLISGAVGGGLYLRFGETRNVTFVNGTAAFLLAPIWIGLLAYQPGV